MRRRPLFAIAVGWVLAAGLEGSANPTAPPGFLGEMRWTMQDPLFGGFSGIEVSADGSGFLAVTDRGGYTNARLTRDVDDRITGIAADNIQLLKGQGTAPLKMFRADSEGLAVASDGRVYISFEGVTRVLRYDRIDGPAENLPVAEAFRPMQVNSSLEALAIDANDVIYTVPERTGSDDRPFPVYRFKNGVWDDAFAIPRSGSFLPVGADIGPDGRFYLLERQFRGWSGFSSRLRRFSISANGFTTEQVLLETPVGLHDNLESVSIWRDDQNRLRATMIADDNFLVLQNTEIVEYLLPD